MTVPAAPLPSLRALVDALLHEASTAASWTGAGSSRLVFLYRSGREALSAAVGAIGEKKGNRKITLWFPAYFCNEALDPLRTPEVKLRFYSVCEDLTPDWTTLEESVKEESAVQILVLVHYFGFPNAVRQAGEFCERHGLELLEDAAHVLLPISGMGGKSVVVFSPRKLLPLPAGGILVVPETMAVCLAGVSENADFGETARWLSRRLAQKILLALRVPWHAVRKARVNGVAAIQPSKRNGSPERCALFALKLLAVLEGQLDEIIQRRRANYARLLEWSKAAPRCRPLFPVLAEEVCPYVFPLVLERETEEIAARLQSVGVPASQWPDLPPEVLAEKGKYRVALELQKRVLLLPVHQSLNQSQTEAVSRRANEALTAVA